MAGRSIGARLRSEQSIEHQNSSHAMNSTRLKISFSFGPSLDFAHRYELGRVPANTKLSANTAVRTVRVRGGNKKFRALRLDTGNFSWGSEVNYNQWSRSDAMVAAEHVHSLHLSQAVTRKARVLDVNYNASNNELVSLRILQGRSRRHDFSRFLSHCRFAPRLL